MNVILYRVRDDADHLNKTLLDPVDTICQVPGEIDLLNPVFLIDGVLGEKNYIYSPSYGRYYFAKPTIINGIQTRFDCNVDVLMSYAGDILNADVIAERSSNRYNNMIPDTYGVISSKKNISITKFPFSFNKEGYNYILRVGGRGV